MLEQFNKRDFCKVLITFFTNDPKKLQEAFNYLNELQSQNGPGYLLSFDPMDYSPSKNEGMFLTLDITPYFLDVLLEKLPQKLSIGYSIKFSYSYLIDFGCITRSGNGDLINVEHFKSITNKSLNWLKMNWKEYPALTRYKRDKNFKWHDLRGRFLPNA